MFVLFCFVIIKSCTGSDCEFVSENDECYQVNIDNDRLAKAERVCDFVRETGGDIHEDIEIYTTDYGELGVRSKEDVSAGTILFNISSHSLLNVMVVENDPIIGNSIRKMNMNYKELESQVLLLSIFIVYHTFVLKEESFYFTYFESFPERFPLIIESPELYFDLLKAVDTPMFEVLMNEKKVREDRVSEIRKIISSDEILIEIFKDLEQFDERMIWAMNNIMTRSFEKVDQSSKESHGLVYMFPVIDFINCASDKMTVTFRYDENDNFIAESEISMLKNDELQFFYRRHVEGLDQSTLANHEILTRYGFIFDDNLNDGILLDIQYMDHEKDYERFMMSMSYLHQMGNYLENSNAQQLWFHLQNRHSLLDKRDVSTFDLHDPVVKWLEYETKEMEKMIQYLSNYLVQGRS